MTFSDFIDRLKEAGWQDTCDAQHDSIFGLWKELLTTQIDAVADVPRNDGLDEQITPS